MFNSMNPDATITMINTRGSVVYVHEYQKEGLLKQGFSIVVNPKQEYYPEYDKENPGWTGTNTQVQNEKIDNYIEVEVI